MNEIFFTFMHIHIDSGKVITVNKNDTATKIHPQTPRPALGLSVKTKKHTGLITVLSMIPPSAALPFMERQLFTWIFPLNPHEHLGGASATLPNLYYVMK